MNTALSCFYSQAVVSMCLYNSTIKYLQIFTITVNKKIPNLTQSTLDLFLIWTYIWRLLLTNFISIIIKLLLLQQLRIHHSVIGC